MKVCPQCQASFEEGYVYCPHDETQLETYDLRGVLRRRRQQEFRGELNLLVPSLSFGERLVRELAFTGSELRRHPLLFVRELLRGEGSTRQRIYLLQSGAAVAVIAYTAITLGLIGWGVAYGLPSVKAELPPKPIHDQEITQLILPPMPKAKSELTRGDKGHLGGSLPQPQSAKGGGSGGNQAPLPASKGATPPAMLKEQVVMLTPEPPKIEHAPLIVRPHVNADPASVKATLGPIGLTDAPLAPRSQGTGTGGGMGNDRGTGLGDKGDGSGLNNGFERGTGGNHFKDGGGPTNGPGNLEGIPMATGSMRPTILYREKARYTEDARAEKVQGAVILLATFTADGRITNIRVLKGLPNGLTQEAIKAAQHIRFNPATRNGVAVTVQARLEYNFSLY
jgi:TonB family protein